MRLFFALWPDAPAASALAQLARALAAPLNGKPVPEDRIHLTLAFLGEVPEERLGLAIAAGDAVRGRGFAMALDHVGSFRRARVAWAGAAEAPAALAALHLRLRSSLEECQLPVEERDFAPHVTLVRDIAGRLARERLPRPIAWEARAFSLVRSESGTGRYSTLASWDLATP